MGAADNRWRAWPVMLVLEYFPTASFGRASWDKSISLKTRLDGGKIAPLDDALMTSGGEFDDVDAAPVRTGSLGQLGAAYALQRT
jgi:hypothetical protein